jgi:predicted ATPase/DNA-binding SARP family transcriptional activator
VAVEVRILGPVEALKDGRTMPLARAKTRALLALLALEEGREVSRDRLIDALWGERELRDANNSLQAQVSQLRRAFEAAGARDVVLTRPTGYALAVDPACIDLVQFERLRRAGRDALSAGDAESASRFLAEALSLWHGEPLGGLADEPFVAPTASRVSELRLTASEDRIEADLALGRHVEVLPELSSLVSEEPYRERLWRQLAVALYRSGRQADALDALRSARRILVDELGLEPGPELRRLERAILEQDEAIAPPGARETTARKLRVPTPTTRLVGREAELGNLRSLLEQPEPRIVTLTGPGGTGKTRLALALAHETAAMFPDGAAFVDLSVVHEPGRVPAAVAEQLGIAEEHGQAPIETLRARLRDRRQLLVLDNFEQVVEAGPTISALSESCPNVRFVVTSRERLRVAAEFEVPVLPLALPEADDPDSVARSPAGALVLERARSVRPGLDLSDNDAAALADVCRGADGLPLALELAATRLRILSPRELAKRIGRPLDVLTGGRRDVAPRHRTLRATLEWSHRLLDADEQRAFAALGVFPADFSLEAAEDVCAEGRRSPLDLVASLVEKSLVQRMETGGRATRLRLLEVVREFAVERLAASGREEEVRFRHAAYFSRFADEAAGALDGPRRTEWLDRLDLERENLRATLEAHLAAGRADEALRMVAALWEWWFVRGHWPEGARWTDRALAAGADASRAARAAALNAGGILAYLACDYSRARVLLEQALAANKEIDDPRGAASALRALAGVEREAGNYESSLRCQEESLQISRELGDAAHVAGSLCGLAMTRLLQGALDDARALSMESLELAERHAAHDDAARALDPLAVAHHYDGQDDRALEFGLRGLRLAREIGYSEAIAWAQYALGLIALRAEDYRAAEASFREALETNRTLGDRWSTARTLEALAAVAAATGAYERGALLLAAADSLRAAIGAPVSPLEQPGRDDVLATLSENLGDRLPDLLARGGKLAPSEVDKLALEASAPELELVPRGHGREL